MIDKSRQLISDLLERLSQKEALLHVIVGRVGGVDVLHPGETSAHPAVLINGLEERREGRKEQRERNEFEKTRVRGNRRRFKKMGKG